LCLIDNPKTMVVRIGKGKEREFHPRFLALMNHYLMDCVACTPASRWEKGQAALNLYLRESCDKLGSKVHPQLKDKYIDTVFELERLSLRPLGRIFDGYVARAVRVSSTCLVQYDGNYYSVCRRPRLNNESQCALMLLGLPITHIWS
jgi:hypothetical protein